MSVPTTPTRPYFMPEGVDWADLPPTVQHLFKEIVEPAYRDLVLTAPNALEQITGVSVVYLLTLELLEHVKLSPQLELTQPATEADLATREKSLNHLLKLCSAKNTAINALIRIRKLPPPSRFSRGFPPATGGAS